MTNFPEDFYTHLDSVNYTEIKGGTLRTTFLEIWVVHVDDRVFARSWNKSKKSWFTAFLDEGKGQLKYGDKILNVLGVKVSPSDRIHTKINEAYLKRYNTKENLFYAEGITQKEYKNYTLEFFPNTRQSQI